ncbi:MAG: prepilin-type N-terminal cleavage/methylation domain-containing protein [Bacilli bacterium]|nr:prepilin-type N-terminal cleavage/methylation domain-containing protein [Bacilli bacterium]
MKNKKGFALIETLITTVVLATALISLYVLFNNMLVKEKRRVYYDDPVYVVRANYIFDLFFKLLKEASNNANNYYPDNFVDFSDLLVEGSESEGTRQTVYLTSFSCDNEIFADKEACKNFFYQMQLHKIYLSKFDTSYINTCDHSNSVKCITYNLLDNQTKLYMKSLPYVPGAEGYYIIFEFIDNGDGNVCANENCMRQYASIKYGGTNTIINLK